MDESGACGKTILSLSRRSIRSGGEAKKSHDMNTIESFVIEHTIDSVVLIGWKLSLHPEKLMTDDSTHRDR